MLRSDIVKIVNTLSRDYSRQARTYTDNQTIIFSFDCMECYSHILNYSKLHKTAPSKNDYKTVNGCLYINNEFITRVAMRYDFPCYDSLNNTGIDYESKILERQEAIYD